MCFSALYCHSLHSFGCSRFVLVVSVPRKTSADSRLGFLLSMRIRYLQDLRGNQTTKPVVAPVLSTHASFLVLVCCAKVSEVPIVLIISPLNTLIDDQIASVTKLGITACKLDASSLEDTVSLAGHEILFTSPEVLETGGARKFIQEIEDRIITIVVDESHCVVNW